MEITEKIKAGMMREVQETVCEANTAVTLGSGTLPVYATPAMTALMERVAAELVEHLLPEGWTSVGISMHIVHTAATPCGMQVRAKAELTAIEGRKLIYRVTAADEAGEIGSGTHERFAVAAEKFLQKAQAKKKL
jgi:fluoroacetyl-CoA thioesterase